MSLKNAVRRELMLGILRPYGEGKAYVIFKSRYVYVELEKHTKICSYWHKVAVYPRSSVCMSTYLCTKYLKGYRRNWGRRLRIWSEKNSCFFLVILWIIWLFIISHVIFPINKLVNLILSGHRLVVQFYISCKEWYIMISFYHLVLFSLSCGLY